MRSGFVRAVGVLGAGTALSQLILLASTPVLTRLLTPADIGVWLVVTSFVYVMATVGSCRYESALAIEPAPAGIAALLRLAMLLLIAAGVGGGLILWLVARAGLVPLGSHPITISVLAAPAVTGLGLVMLVRALKIREVDFKPISRVTVLRALVGTVLRIGLGLAQVGAPGLILSEAVAPWVVLLIYRRTWLRPLQAAVAGRRSGGMRVVAIRYRRIALLETPSILIDQAAMMLPMPMLAALYGPAEAGLFGLAYRLVALPTGQIGAAIGDVFFASLAQRVRAGDVAGARHLFWKLARHLAAIGVAPCAVVALSAPFLFPFVLGAEWAAAGEYAVILAPWVYAGFVVSTLSRALVVLQRQDLKLVYDVAALTLLGLVPIAASTLQWPVRSTVIAVSAANVALYLLYFTLMALAFRARAGGGGQPAPCSADDPLHAATELRPPR